MADESEQTWRVEDDHVEGASFIAEFTQELKTSPSMAVCLSAGRSLRRDILFAQFQCVSG